tara:strand:+ start:166 stop:438 length:273 start_codon:yes stop_codon:yes gene_type:complete
MNNNDLILQLDELFDNVAPTISNLLGRWKEESQFEDFADYAEVMKKALPAHATFIRATKRPFAVVFSLAGDDRKFQVFASAKCTQWKQVA